MGYYADLIKAKQNAKEEKGNDSEGRLMEIAEKVLREYPESTKSYAKFEDRFLTKAGWGYNPSKVKTIKEIWERVANSKEEKDNEKENSILSTEMYKGYKIEVYKAKAGVDYGFNIYDKRGALFDWGTYFDSERDALRWAKLAIDRKANSKEEKEEGYYAKLAEEKKNGKSYSNEDIPFTKKSECVATLDKIINLAQRKKSQVQGWRYIDEDFDENGFASDLKDALRAVENIIG